MIYLDNAATGGFKPRKVTEIIETTTKYLCANPGRSSHSLSLTGEKLIFSTREQIASMFDCPVERVIFTKNCTEALNTAIFGTLKKGGHVITTIYEHNSVLRPLQYLKSLGLIELDIVCPYKDIPLTQLIKKKIRKNTYLVVCTSASNVTGQILPIREVGDLCKRLGITFLVDGAQGGGHIPLSLVKDNISILCLAGHKGLYGVMGSGVLIFNQETTINPILFGGTGTETFNLSMPLSYPERLEAGTLSLPIIASLNEGVKFIQKNLTSFAFHIEKATEKIIGDLLAQENIKIYSKPNPVGIVAVGIKNLDSNFVCDILDKEYNIAVRGGFHCAPLIHKHLKTDKSGLVRISLAVQNTAREITCVIEALKKIAKDFNN